MTEFKKNSLNNIDLTDIIKSDHYVKDDNVEDYTYTLSQISEMYIATRKKEKDQKFKYITQTSKVEKIDLTYFCKQICFAFPNIEFNAKKLMLVYEKMLEENWHIYDYQKDAIFQAEANSIRTPLVNDNIAKAIIKEIALQNNLNAVLETNN